MGLLNSIEFSVEVTKVRIGQGVDFNKAFDKDPHGRLIQKMHVIHDDLVIWFQNCPMFYVMLAVFPFYGCCCGTRVITKMATTSISDTILG